MFNFVNICDVDLINITNYVDLFVHCICVHACAYIVYGRIYAHIYDSCVARIFYKPYV